MLAANSSKQCKVKLGFVEAHCWPLEARPWLALDIVHLSKALCSLLRWPIKHKAIMKTHKGHETFPWFISGLLVLAKNLFIRNSWASDISNKAYGTNGHCIQFGLQCHWYIHHSLKDFKGMTKSLRYEGTDENSKYTIRHPKEKKGPNPSIPWDLWRET